MSESDNNTKRNVNNPSKQRKSLLGVLDIFVLVAVLTMIIGLFGRMYIGKRIGVSYEDTVSIVYVIEGISVEGSDGIKEGDYIDWVKYDDEGNAQLYMHLGEVKTRENRTSSIAQEEGDEHFVVIDPQHCDVVCSLETKGKMTDGGFMLGGTQYLAAGMKIPVRCSGDNGYYANILILNVSEK